MIDNNISQYIRCPVCKSVLAKSDTDLVCESADCGLKFPVVNNIPVLLNEDNSVFKISDYQQPEQEESSDDNGKLKSLLYKIVPSLSNNVRGQKNYDSFLSTITENKNAKPKILVVGGEVLGEGMDSVASSSAVELVQSDVAIGPQTQLVCDCHDLPFEDEVFDGVIVQAVLEHVIDPVRCVSEIHRVLKADGLVYSETPFMQQVHIPGYDFTRFTHQGHRRLFRNFIELDSGPVCGPGMALSWAYEHFLVSFSDSGKLRSLLRLFARLSAFWIKYFDYILVYKKSAYDSASAFFFVGKKSTQPISDVEVVKSYKGALS